MKIDFKKTVDNLGVFYDITDRKKAEDELKKKIEELERFNKVTVCRDLKMKELKKKKQEFRGKTRP